MWSEVLRHPLYPEFQRRFLEKYSIWDKSQMDLKMKERIHNERSGQLKQHNSANTTDGTSKRPSCSELSKPARLSKQQVAAEKALIPTEADLEEALSSYTRGYEKVKAAMDAAKATGSRKGVVVLFTPSRSLLAFLMWRPWLRSW
ncbi:hypothetical protein CEUSTIGMA_g13767.t1 [Chlamydomonas eustigma]|uniref:Uncharacterized protein n=1 Tax=Chlamydomonas eustigma TaxID=1157962 RepID=A0A250XTG7_9CHLO|nr:hypothetical protein CEUSTIGMA_g13767.t1 [Chlamydomonas eustigma]|eukprot:GAX86355.1 hypothetical protein CEUSTIGMA_g13767.t1 [Chlamydomonas eustigma]